MDIQKTVHEIQNVRQVILMGLEADATEDMKIQAKRAFDKETKMLQAIASNITSKVVVEGGLPVLKYYRRGA